MAKRIVITGIIDRELTDDEWNQLYDMLNEFGISEVVADEEE